MELIIRIPGGLLGTEWLMGEWACDENSLFGRILLPFLAFLLAFQFLSKPNVYVRPWLRLLAPPMRAARIDSGVEDKVGQLLSTH